MQRPRHVAVKAVGGMGFQPVRRSNAKADGQDARPTNDKAPGTGAGGVSVLLCARCSAESVTA